MRSQEPSPSSLLSTLGSALFSLGGGIPVLGTLSNTVNQPLPLIGESIAQLTGLDNDLPRLPIAALRIFPILNGSYSLAGGTLTVDVTPTTIQEFLDGQDVSLVSWQTSGDVNLVDEDKTVPIFSLGVPDIASVELDATFGIHASLQYDIGFGLDGHGFYALAGSPTDPTLGLIVRCHGRRAGTGGSFWLAARRGRRRHRFFGNALRHPHDPADVGRSKLRSEQSLHERSRPVRQPTLSRTSSTI